MTGSIEIYRDLEQGSPEWLQARAGIATASEFATLLVKGKGPYGLGAGAVTYAYEKAGEIITGQPAPNFTSFEMERGKVWEAEVAAQYEFINDVHIERVGFMRRNRIGYSPDGLVGENGLIEIKTHQPKKLIGMLLDAEFPSDHRWQAVGGLMVSCREWIDLVGYWPGLPHLNRRLYREQVEKDIEQLDDALQRFNAFVDEIVAKIGGAA